MLIIMTTEGADKLQAPPFLEGGGVWSVAPLPPSTVDGAGAASEVGDNGAIDGRGETGRVDGAWVGGQLAAI